MDNLFFCEPEHISEDRKQLILTGQEAIHCSKVLRKRTGDRLSVADGAGSHYSCTITMSTKQQVFASIDEAITQDLPDRKKVLALGSIKKRDRLEFAIEKAVELGATELCLFNSDHSERTRINEDRTRQQIISAFKQSGRFWLPDLRVKDSLEEVLAEYADLQAVMAHEKTKVQEPGFPAESDLLLLVGPEGGFSPRETNLVESSGGMLISLGANRLRAETAVTAILSLLLFR